jgi:hypothetical protein
MGWQKVKDSMGIVSPDSGQKENMEQDISD